MTHNVYDFDKTIYKGDATIDFFLFCLRRNPLLLLGLLPFLFSLGAYFLGFSSKTEMKEHFFSFLRRIESVDAFTEEFWENNKGKIKPFYKRNAKEDDVVISASPEFLLVPVCFILGIRHLIASRVDKRTGIFDGENCWGQEKVRRLGEMLPGANIREFYSDSLSDAPLAAMAERAYLVRGEKIIPWEEHQPSLLDKVKTLYLAKEFLLFIFCGGMGTLTNFLVSLFLSIKLEPTLSYFFGYAVSLFVAYALNAKIIYKESLKAGAFAKFVVSYIPNFLILFSFVALFLNVLHWNKVLVYALAGLLGLPVTYSLVKVFAFAKSKE